MPSLQLLCVILLLSASCRAEETGGAIQSNNVTNERSHQEVKSAGKLITAPQASENPVESTAKVQPVTQTPTPAPPGVEEGPYVAAKHIEGTLGLDSIPRISEPDAIKKVLGSRCTGDKECVSVNTRCIDGVCICSSGFIPSKHSLDTCLKVPNGVGDACEEEAQCDHAVPDSECRDSKCECPLNFVYLDTRCWEKQILGGTCNNSAQCEDITFAGCVQGVCTCEDPLIPSPINKCLQPAGKVYEAPCAEDIQCTHSYGDEARCKNSLCICTNNHHFNGSKCIPDKNLGDTCSIHEDCAVSSSSTIEDSRTCLENICDCAPGFKVLTGEDICTKSSGEELAVSLTWVLCIIVAKYYLS